MNDFTKDELEGILLCIIHGSWTYRADKKTIINKIQSLIENYSKNCDHNSTNYDDGLYYCDDCGIFVK